MEYSRLKKLAYVAKEYIKRYVFNMVVLVALIIFGILHFSEFTMMGIVYRITQSNKTALTQYKNESNELRNNDKKDLIKTITEYVDRNDMEIASRVDIIDSASNPEDKRKMMVVKVRNAITENTDTKLNIRDLNNIAAAIIDYSYQYNLSIARVLAQIKQESNFKIKVRSRAKAQGLMQIIPETWDYVVLKEFERKNADPDNIYNNIRAGCFYMAEQIHKFDTYDQALMAYNWGPDKVRKLLAGEYAEDDIPQETRNYVKNINIYIDIFQKYGLE